MSSPRRASVATSFRPDVQGLRTVAVMAVVLYHLWPKRITGGFVGVDVFFVISGFLITGHMYRELMANSGLSLVKFWGRRIRRLLPAAFVVLLLSLAAVYLWVPATLWESTARQVGSSALYVQNWVLAADSVDYSALNADATVAQHYWSLSIEEQFYISWPLIMIALLWIVHRLARRVPTLPHSPRATLIAGLTAIGAASLAYSIYETNLNPAAAYFVTPTRVWEFAVGALVALVFLDRQFSGPLATAVAWTGLGGLVVSALLYSSETPFPGYTALLPVAGTAALLCCSGTTSTASPAWLLSRKPATFVGDISYAVYLWHWPLIIVVPYALQTNLNWALKLGILGLSILLSWLTKLLIEDPFRKGPWLRGSVRTYSFAAVGMIVVTGMCFGLTALANAPAQADPALTHSSCYGPGALDSANSCGSVLGTAAPNPTAVMVSNENTQPLYPGCQANFPGSDLVSCNLGVPASAAKATVAMVGDSHATAWYPAMDALAKKHSWSVVTYSKASCPVSTALRILPNEKTSENQNDCHTWVIRLNDALKADHSISAVFTASYSSAYQFKSADGDPLKNPAVDGFTQMWAGWQAAGKKVVVFDDVPRTNGQYIPTCLAKNPGADMKCAFPVAQALPANMNITKAAEQAAKDGVIRVQLRKEFCDSKWCYPVVGSVIVYRDYSHISAEYSRALVPYLDLQLRSLKIGN
ncbi:acyltransferase family protein [Arthrobacter sp. A2-55]|uniref:acyltransferase family protein n=1 Tax=Arthrobacter sp. A2-55 TaxID=2897337 RepID=UPI0021CD922A|nr:acyltransferase family protein [Arthrobacter sp. A2-55]MCU6481890.1 acyltransferase [Arthrobacter sp. A2-55]